VRSRERGPSRGKARKWLRGVMESQVGDEVRLILDVHS